MAKLPIYLWSEGFGARLITQVANDVTSDNSFKITGLIMGDPMVSFDYQYNNFGSFAKGRYLANPQDIKSIFQYETSFLLADKTNSNLCQFHRDLYRTVQPSCPFNVLKSCPELSQTTNCNIFLRYSLESTRNKEFDSFLKNNFDWVISEAQTDTLLSGRKEPFRLITDDNISNTFSKMVNKMKVLVYQSQNNIMSNSISTMLYVDYLKWRGFSNFVAVESQEFGSNTTDIRQKYTLKHYDNLWKVQLFGVGSDMIDEIGDFIFSEIFPRFTL